MRYLISLMLLLVLAGCENGLFGSANPRTEFSYGASGAKFYDSKNNDIDVAGEYDPETGRVSVSKFVVRNNASDVRLANVEQMLGLAKQQEQFNQGIREVRGIVSDIGGMVTELRMMRYGQTQIDTPWGTYGSTRSTSQPAAGSSRVLDEILSRLSALESRLPADPVPPVE